VPRIEHSRVIPAAPQDVWDLLCEPRFDEWVAGTDEVFDASGPMQEGATYRERNPVLGPWKATTSWRVTAFEAPRRQVHEGEGVPLARRFVLEETLAEAEGGQTRLTIAFDIEPAAGPLGRAFLAVMSGRLRADLRATLDGFATFLEEERTGSRPGGEAAA
jgi:hypothetical protein